MARELISPETPKELEKIMSEMDRLWETFLFGKPKEKVFEEEREAEEGCFFPLDVSETKDEIVVSAEIRGLDPGGIDVSLSGNVLTIKGKKEQEEEERGDKYYLLQERNYGTFCRSVELPGEVQSGKASASYCNGVLRIVLPKFTNNKTREIKIKTE